MANKIRGEVALDAGEKKYTLRFSSNALCEMEDALGMGINAISSQLADPASMRIKTVRTMLWAGLRDRHGEVTDKGAGDILDAVGLSAAMEKISEAFALAFGDGKPDPTQPPA